MPSSTPFILHSGYANLRLESYLTEQAFSDVKRVLRSGRVFVMYHNMRQGWIIERVIGVQYLI